MKIYKLDIEKLIENLLNLVEEYVFEESTMSPNFSIDNKEACKNTIKLQIEKVFEDYDVIEVKNNYKFKKEKKKKLFH